MNGYPQWTWSFDAPPTGWSGRSTPRDIMQVYSIFMIMDVCTVNNEADHETRSIQIVVYSEKTEAELREMDVVRRFVELYGSPYDKKLELEFWPPKSK